MRFSAEPLHQASGESRLAHPWFTGEQDDAPISALRLDPASQKNIDFLIPPDQWKQVHPRMQFLRAAPENCLCNCPGGILIRKSLQRHGSEIVALE